MRLTTMSVMVGVLLVGGQLPVGNWQLTGAAANAQPRPESQPPKQQEEFVPIDQLPPEEQLPAAPMVVAAYAFIWIAFLGYVFTLIRRIRKVEGDLRSLEQGRR